MPVTATRNTLRGTLSAALIAALCATMLAAAARPLQAQTPPNTLPAAARQFLEVDQLQRWSNLLQLGDSLFNTGSCVRCHASGGKGSERAPDLTDTVWVHSDGGFEGIFEAVFWGIRRKDFHDPGRRFEMNPGGGMNLDWNEMRAVSAYVWSLNNGSFLPPRR